jgi:hypothetical protein
VLHPTTQQHEESEAADLIAFVFALKFFLHFQPKNRMSSPKAT